MSGATAPATTIPRQALRVELAHYATAVRHPLRRPQLRFAIVAHARSGSNLLVELLNQHPQVDCLGELLSRRVRWPYLFLLGAMRRRERTVFGFKLLDHHLTTRQATARPETFIRALHRRGWRLIHLQRHNLLRQSLSEIVAGRRRQWHHTSGEQQYDAPRFTLPWRRLQATLDQAAADRRWRTALLAELPHAHVMYERDLLHADQHQATADRLFAALGLPPAPVTARHRPVTPRRLDAIIDNDAAIRAALLASPYADFLDDSF